MAFQRALEILVLREPAGVGGMRPCPAGPHSATEPRLAGPQELGER